MSGWDKLGNTVEKGPWHTMFVVLAFTLVFALVIGAFSGGFGYVRQRFLEPEMESARRITYEQNRSYVTGNIEELRRLKLQYDLAPAEEKSIIAASIRGQFGQFDRSHLDADLLAFLKEMDTVR